MQIFFSRSLNAMIQPAKLVDVAIRTGAAVGQIQTGTGGLHLRAWFSPGCGKGAVTRKTATGEGGCEC
jgi:hypothetical protein